MAPTPVRERTRREIQEQATRLFAAKGYEATSLQDIAEAVGCSKATVLYHFEGKPAVLSYVMEPTVHALTDLVAAVRDLPPEAAQERTIVAYVDLAVRFRGLTTVLREVLPLLEDAPEFEALRAAGGELPRLLAGSADPGQWRMAKFALNGLIGACRDFCNESDDELRELLTTVLRRLLLPAAG